MYSRKMLHTFSESPCIYICSHFGFDGLMPMLKRPQPLPSWLGLVTPFQTTVWITITLTLLIATITLVTCTKYSKLPYANDYSLHFLEALNPLAGRNVHIEYIEKARAARLNDMKMLAFEIFLITYFWGSFVIHVGYEGSLKSHLAAVIFPKPIQTLDEFARSDSYSDIIFVNPELNDLLHLFKTSNITSLVNIAKGKVIRGRSMSIPKFYLEANKGHALVSSRGLFEFNIKRQLTYRDGTTDMQIVPQFLSGYPRTMHITRMNRFSKLLNKRLSQWNEAGLFQQTLKWIMNGGKRAYLDDSETLRRSGTNFHRLTFGMYRLVSIFYLFGVTLAVIIFMFEFHAISKSIN